MLKHPMKQFTNLNQASLRRIGEKLTERDNIMAYRQVSSRVRNATGSTRNGTYANRNRNALTRHRFGLAYDAAKKSVDMYRLVFRSYIASCIRIACVLEEGAYQLAHNGPNWHGWRKVMAPRDASAFYVNTAPQNAGFIKAAPALLELDVQPRLAVLGDVEVRVTREAGQPVALYAVRVEVTRVQENRAHKTYAAVGVARDVNTNKILRAGAWATFRARDRRQNTHYAVFEGLRLAVDDVRKALHGLVGKSRPACSKLA